MKINSISATDPEYPARLQNIPDKPKKLFLIGQLPNQQRKVVAIVGSRKPTPYGRGITQQIASQLAAKGVVIVSGLALGIDSIAHQACLDAGGVTLAVLPSSLDTIYPRTHVSLAKNIIDSGGGLISEHKDNPMPRAYDFLSRNRLVSGLADVLIVTEAALRSGTMSTVAHALAQGKDVYAVPGNITSPLSSGCNQLIAQGAAPIVNVEEFVDLIVPRPKQAASHKTFAQNENQQLILDLLENGLSDGEELLQSSNLNAALFQQTMTIMEIQGTIQPLGANQWATK